MGKIVVEGGRPLCGEVTVQGAKNSVLPILAATVLCRDTCVIQKCPRLRDVETTTAILRHLGCRVAWEGDDLVVDSRHLTRCDIPDALMRQMRSSVIFLGAILGRCGEAELSFPGGCELGPRPIDLHLAALCTLGAETREENGRFFCRGETMRGAEIVLSLPSVGATENAMLAACTAEGTTTICNAAREPEIVDLQAFLRKMGADVWGAGSSAITVCGGRELHGCTHRVIGDRIAAATYLSAAAGAGGDICLKNVDYRHLSAVTTVLIRAGCRITCGDREMRAQSDGRLRAVPPIHTSPYPGFPTDAQAVVMAALCRSEGTTVFVENMFTNRYRHVPELQRMGAEIRTEGRVAVVCGRPRLCGAAVYAAELRGGAALVTAALQAEGCTTVENVQYIQRGYSDLPGDLHALGAEIRLAE
ncbi:MAG: UDP-N-acetylglucosamine 1-carboxyvinyltransferase [Clostridiales bacterium]|nr:UDP-N-acetylglucosamine 1-carboxyvinyltransferase [Candidatus Cacconaster stercorequi]